MSPIVIPCHTCGQNNSIDAIHCGWCHAVVRLQLQPTVTTQLLSEATGPESKEMKLIREAYLVSALLLQSAHHLRALLDQVGDDD